MKIALLLGLTALVALQAAAVPDAEPAGGITIVPVASTPAPKAKHTDHPKKQDSNPHKGKHHKAKQHKKHRVTKHGKGKKAKLPLCNAKAINALEVMQIAQGKCRHPTPKPDIKHKHAQKHKTHKHKSGHKHKVHKKHKQHPKGKNHKSKHGKKKHHKGKRKHHKGKDKDKHDKHKQHHKSKDHRYKHKINTDPLILSPHAIACIDKNPDANTALKKFCSKAPTLTVPSKEAHDAAYAGDVFARIGDLLKEKRTCDPPTKVSSEQCIKNFQKICAEGSWEGYGVQRFGPQPGPDGGGCQWFELGSWKFDSDPGKVTYNPKRSEMPATEL